MLKLADFASNPLESKGRFIEEIDENLECCFLKDRTRIINSVAFRRLEYKTQVFVNHTGDHYRTRLTHTLEVSQIARTICRRLFLNEDLAETIALCHDLGHPPFGHAGESALNESAKNYGGFEHNIHTIKILTKLENKYVNFEGLNLTWETIEGIVKHNGPIVHNNKKDIPGILIDLSNKKDLCLNRHPSLEAQVANLADDIAYIVHDIDDGIRAGFFNIGELEFIGDIKKISYNFLKKNHNTDIAFLVAEVVREISEFLIEDLISQTKYNLEKFKINSSENIRDQSMPIAHFSDKTELTKKALKAFLTDKVYRNYRINRMTVKGRNVLQEIFNRLMEKSECLPTEWFTKTVGKSKKDLAQIIIDYIAGMTDRYAIEEHKKLFDFNSF
jgi:dGTPase